MSPISLQQFTRSVNTVTDERTQEKREITYGFGMRRRTYGHTHKYSVGGLPPLPSIYSVHVY